MQFIYNLTGSCFYLLSVEVGVPSEGASGAGEGEHGEGHWDGNVDSDLERSIDTNE